RLRQFRGFRLFESGDANCTARRAHFHRYAGLRIKHGWGYPIKFSAEPSGPHRKLVTSLAAVLGCFFACAREKSFSSHPRFPSWLAEQPVVCSASIISSAGEAIECSFDHALLVGTTASQCKDDGAGYRRRLQPMLRLRERRACLEHVAQQMIRWNVI